MVYTIGRNGWSNLVSICSKAELEEGRAVIWFWAWEQVEKSYLQVISVCLINSGYTAWTGLKIQSFFCLVSFLFYEPKNWAFTYPTEILNHWCHLFFHMKYLREKKKKGSRLSFLEALGYKTIGSEKITNLPLNKSFPDGCFGWNQMEIVVAFLFRAPPPWQSNIVSSPHLRKFRFCILPWQCHTIPFRHWLFMTVICNDGYKPCLSANTVVYLISPLMPKMFIASRLDFW